MRCSAAIICPQCVAHALERGHVHGGIDHVAGAGIDAGQPIGRHVEAQGARKDVGFADLAAVGVHRDMRHAEDRDDELQVAQLDRTAGQFLGDLLALRPCPRSWCSKPAAAERAAPGRSPEIAGQRLTRPRAPERPLRSIARTVPGLWSTRSPGPSSSPRRPETATALARVSPNANSSGSSKEISLLP